MKKSLLSLAVVSLLSADTTMCFKENWTKISQIETTTLDGGKCDSKYSVQDMKTNGWKVDDIKITPTKTGMSYMYIFKKGNIVSSNVFSGTNADEISEEIIALVEQRMVAKEEKVKAIKVEEDKALGGKIYKEVCAQCHGENANISAYSSARPLNTLSVSDIEIAFRDYSLSQKDNGMAILMIPYAEKYSFSTIKNIALYIQTLKK